MCGLRLYVVKWPSLSLYSERRRNRRESRRRKGRERGGREGGRVCERLIVRLPKPAHVKN